MPKKAVWLSYDLGVRGDYEGMYTWLDDLDAKECGDRVAFLNYGYRKSLAEEMEEDIRASVELGRRARIYITFQDSKTKRLKGRFLVGKRKSPPWSGFSSRTTDDIEDF
ncbi:MAG: hypothetical protein GKR94_13610 [Gammaproteobacteria bacterium]|nr:hypothetical protein [Gammaproteobacteria bacterium]